MKRSIVIGALRKEIDEAKTKTKKIPLKENK